MSMLPVPSKPGPGYHCGLCAALSALSASRADAAAPPAPGRRRFGAGALAVGASLALPAWAQQREGVDVGKKSWAVGIVPAEQVEQAATQQYAQMMREAAAKKALAPDSHPQALRLRAISQRIIPFAASWNERARQWRWEVNLLGSDQINAFCMPGGKIAFYSGILSQLQLSDDEVATVMGHEVAHALREHARERIGKGSATSFGLSLGAQLLGLGSLGDLAANIGTQLLTMRFGREDETEADLVGMELAARSGYDPRAGVTLWRKMSQASKGAPPQWLSTHPSHADRVAVIESNLPRVLPLFERAPKPVQRFAPMERSASRPQTPGAESSR